MSLLTELTKCIKNDLFIKFYHLRNCSLRNRLYCNSKKLKDKQFIGNFKNCVLISNTKDIFENLAIEDWLYRYQNFDNNQLLLLWFNRPSVVIGRHQNTWREINLEQCSKSNISIARRNSGGGTVYHDLNNLNICFFASKRSYDRKSNLKFIQETIKKNFQINLNINCKEDLILDKTNEKVSGTASKLAHNKSYHHCTLLIDSNLTDLSKFIRKKSDHIITNATKSVYSPVKNLSAIHPSIQIENVIDALADSYKQIHNSNIHHVDFDETIFPSINELKNELQDWNWVFGKSPKFKIIKTDLINDEEYRCELNIVKGLIEQVDLFKQDVQIVDYCLPIIGKRLVLEDCETVLNDWLKSRNDFKSLYLNKLILDTIRSIYF